MNTMTIVLKSIINYGTLGMGKCFQVTCFKHAFFKVFQYATTKKKMCKGLKYVSIKSTPSIFAKMYNMVLNVGKWKTKMDESLHYYMP
jgi:hypothetical protein